MIYVETIPAELKEFKQWVCWKYEVKEGKETKVPINAKNGFYASTNDPSTWTSFAYALDYYLNRNGKQIEGIGFTLSTNDPLTGMVV